MKKAIFMVFTLVLLCAMAWIPRGAPPCNLPVLIKAPVPAFSLQVEDGKTYTEANLSNKVTVVYPYFVGCATTCPLLQARVIYPLFQKHGADQNFQALGFSIDPADTPATMKTQKKGLGNYAGWHFLVYNQKATTAVAAHFRFTIQNKIQHSNAAVLVDGSGNVRAIYDGSDASAAKFKEAVACLLQDK